MHTHTHTHTHGTDQSAAFPGHTNFLLLSVKKTDTVKLMPFVNQSSLSIFAWIYNLFEQNHFSL